MTCFAPVRGRRMRVTKVNECGVPIYGDCAQVVSKGFTSIEFSPQTDDGEEISVRNAGGELCVSEPACKTMTGIEVTANFCQVDTDIFALMTGEEPVVGPDGRGVGFDIGDIPCNAGSGLEVWTGIHSQTACGEAGGAAQFGYLVLPWLSAGTLGDFTVEDGAITFSLTATAKSGSGWGVGPHAVQNDADGNPGPLFTPLRTDKFGRMIVTDVAPPEPVCGCQTLVEPPWSPLSLAITPESVTLDAAAA